MQVSLPEATKTIRDALRYTFIIDDANYSTLTATTINTLLEQGNNLISFKNYWAMDDYAYQGINTVFFNTQWCNFRAAVPHTEII